MQTLGNPHMKYAAKMYFVVTAAAQHGLQMEEVSLKGIQNLVQRSKMNSENFQIAHQLE